MRNISITFSLSYISVKFDWVKSLLSHTIFIRNDLFRNLQMSLMIRPVEQNDAESCGKIGYKAYKTISSAHGYSSDQPSEEFGIALIKRLLGDQNSWDVLAERQGKTLGSIFLHKFPPSPVAVIGPLTVHPSAEGGG
jgi:hypothetical protein